MTWVVGGKHVFCARCISDVQVTLKLKNGPELYFDAVKKIHVIGPGLAVAFAGSIKLAFAIVDVLRNEFYPRLDQRRFSAPDEIARRMRRWIAHFYNKKKTLDGEKLEFLVLAAPTGLLTEFGLWKMCAPAFNIVQRQQPFEMLELGTGASTKAYREAIERHSKGVYIVDEGPGEKPTAVIPVGKVALQYVFAEALDYQTAGISRSMHITLVSHRGIVTRELPEKAFETFPRVADTWVELKRFIRAKGIAVADCYALA
jgi:hypothetical protein